MRNLQQLADGMDPSSGASLVRGVKAARQANLIRAAADGDDVDDADARANFPK